MSSRAWRSLRLRRFRLDGFECQNQKCRKVKAASGLEAHHIVGSLRADLRRGRLASIDAIQTLCSNCHRDAHSKSGPVPERARWDSYVKALS